MWKTFAAKLNPVPKGTPSKAPNGATGDRPSARTLDKVIYMTTYSYSVCGRCTHPPMTAPTGGRKEVFTMTATKITRAAMPTVTTYAYADALSGIRAALTEKGWTVDDIAAGQVPAVPRMVDGNKTLPAQTVAYDLTDNNAKAYYLSRYGIMIEAHTLAALKAAENDETKRPVAVMWEELRDALRAYPVTIPDALPTDAAQVYLAFLAKSVTSKTDFTVNPVLSLLYDGFMVIKAEIEKAKAEKRKPSNTAINRACKEMVEKYGGTVIATAKTRELSDRLTNIFYPTLRIDRKSGTIRPFTKNWFAGFEQYALCIAKSALEKPATE